MSDSTSMQWKYQQCLASSSVILHVLNDAHQQPWPMLFSQDGPAALCSLASFLSPDQNSSNSRHVAFVFINVGKESTSCLPVKKKKGGILD